jgi:6-phosphogluconolactonase
MSSFDLIQFPGDERLARTVADEWLKELEAANPNPKRPYCVALSGGRIARRFFSAVADLAKTRGSCFASVHFFWGDERCVPPTDPESNFALAQELLLRPLNIPENQIHRIRGELLPPEAAAQAQAEITRIAPLNAEGQPILDLIFLGMGEDGHVASLFPGETEDLMRSPEIFRPVVAVKPPPHRITIGYPTIAAARQAWVLASGPGKEAALRECRGPGGKNPLVRVIKLRSHTKIFTDIAMEDRPGFSQSEKKEK